ncbi:MAG: 50S ribosomal protein L17 [Lentisphaeria bacterium]|nr:50S ribosomal protein L17 [Lentisphaeria bacterium]
MRHRKHTFKINRTGSHRRAMMANMACSLIVEGRIKTTLVRAKELRKIVEKMITLGKRGSSDTRRHAALRQAVAYLRQPSVVRVLFDDIAPRFANRAGGYTRIMKLGPRVGDAAEMCLIEILTDDVSPKAEAAPKAEGAEKTVAAPATQEAAETEEAVEATVSEEDAETDAVVDEEKNAG